MSILMNILNAGIEGYMAQPKQSQPDNFTPAPGFEKVKKQPKVQKFAGNIYFDEYFSTSVYFDYTKAFWEGYRMTTYQQAEECQDDFGAFMDLFHEFHLNMTRRRSDDSIENWYDPYRLIAYTIGNSFNDFWYNCFRFVYDIYETYKEKFDNFVDFGDIYLSFIFNMLSKSVEIKEDVESMIAAFDIHDTERFVRGLASILRNVFDFESY